MPWCYRNATTENECVITGSFCSESEVLKSEDEPGWSLFFYVWSPRQQKQRQTTRVNEIQEARRPPLLLSNTKPQENNPIRLIAVMCVGGVVISSGVISQLLWWTCEHETMALREASRSTLISWYGDGGDVSFDLAVTARGNAARRLSGMQITEAPPSSV